MRLLRTTTLSVFIVGFFIYPARCETSSGDSDWRIERLVLPADGVVEGEEVISTDVDIDGDGLVERLVTLKLGMANGKAGNIWCVFGKSGERYFSFGTINLRIDNARLYVFPELSSNPKLYSIYPLSGSERGLGVLRHSDITGSEVIENFETKVDITEHVQEFGAMEKPTYRSMRAAELYHKYDVGSLESIWIKPGEAFQRNQPVTTDRPQGVRPRYHEDRVHGVRSASEPDLANELRWPVVLAGFLGSVDK